VIASHSTALRKNYKKTGKTEKKSGEKNRETGQESEREIG